MEFLVRARGRTRAQRRRRGRAAFAFRAVRQRSGFSQEPTQEIAEEPHGKTSLADHEGRILRVRAAAKIAPDRSARLMSESFACTASRNRRSCSRLAMNYYAKPLDWMARAVY